MTRPMMRVMIVDDHDLIRRGVRSLVETRPYYMVVGEAADGAEAINVAAGTSPDIAILDYAIPEKNGLAVSEALKKLLPRIEIVLFTLCDREDLISEMLRAGIRGFVLKSESERHLLGALDSVSNHRPYYSRSVSETLIGNARGKRALPASGCLTAREREVVQLIAEGSINKQIADKLTISVKTVETHRASAMHKLNLRTTADLVRYAIRNELVDAYAPAR